MPTDQARLSRPEQVARNKRGLIFSWAPNRIALGALRL